MGPDAEELAARARRRYAEARRIGVEAARKHEAAERWRRRFEADLQARWQDVQRRAEAITAGATKPGLSLFDADFCQVSDPDAISAALLSAALALTRAPMGNVQLAAEDGLRIAAQHGFDADFLEHFAFVRGRDSACGVALAESRAVHVHDVEQSEAFPAGPSRDAVLEAGVRAVRSIPLIGDGGTLLGVMSVHYRTPHAPSPAERSLLTTLATAGARRLNRPAHST
ncbi:GAF domain-containing protein [Actinoplanes sp. NPDC051861]|uniref:GAF domain-containing protein n=1 Tax=Actinoplanes sp. NPDC051861 TaxID=3155170 RepID=UPI00342D05ED